jgi:hypothetical protein
MIPGKDPCEEKEDEGTQEGKTVHEHPDEGRRFDNIESPERFQRADFCEWTDSLGHNGDDIIPVSLIGPFSFPKKQLVHETRSGSPVKVVVERVWCNRWLWLDRFRMVHVISISGIWKAMIHRRALSLRQVLELHVVVRHVGTSSGDASGVLPRRIRNVSRFAR